MARWNVRRLNGTNGWTNEKFSLNVLGIAETNKKGKKKLERHWHIMLLSRVIDRVRAQEGASCIIKSNAAGYLKGWEYILKREYLKQHKDIYKYIMEFRSI